MILGTDGNPMPGAPLPAVPCDHGLIFDAEEARRILERFTLGSVDTVVSFIQGNPNAAEVRRRWPRLAGNCPKGCGYSGIAYASAEHYAAGDW